MSYASGRHFLQIPGPTNIPDRILRAIDQPIIDPLGQEVLAGLKPIFKTGQPVIIYPASGSGAWEAALVNTMSPGDKVLMCETGYFAFLWQQIAARLGIDAHVIETDWQQGANPEAIGEALAADGAHKIKAICIVHNETSTGAVSNIPRIRQAMDAATHPALLMVDTISSLASIDYRMDDWGVDVTVAGSQKGLMLPPGLSFNAVSDRALAASKNAKLPKSYWSWDDMLNANRSGFFPYTPATNLLYGLREAIAMLNEEGLDNVFARHTKHGVATRLAVEAWGLETVCKNPDEFSASITAVMMPGDHSADRLREVILDNFAMSLGTGLGRLADTVFRIGHLGDFNDLMLAGTLSGVEMGLTLAEIPHQPGGVRAALDYLARNRQ
jgi:alanine-glyoxylate transaminase/serine-glyoxylate transaminase/serine-pyruvate transaminase